MIVEGWGKNQIKEGKWQESTEKSGVNKTYRIDALFVTFTLLCLCRIFFSTISL
jgi:hypothetical protein